MQKLLLLLLPLAIAACVDRDTAPANGAGTPRVETYPSAPSSSAPTPSSPSTPSEAGAPAQRTTLPGRGEGERESPAPMPPAPSSLDDDMPDGSIDVSETSEVERNRAGSNDAAPGDDAPRVPRFDPTDDPAVIDESGAPGFGGRVSAPEALGDGELRADDEDGSIEPDELPMLPADVVDAGPALIP